MIKRNTNTNSQCSNDLIMTTDFFLLVYQSCQLYGHLPPITKTIQARQTRHAGHCWRSKDEIVSDVLLWTPAYGQSKAGRPARTYIQQLCDDTGCNPEAMNDRETWRERVRDIHASRTTWWWWIYLLKGWKYTNCMPNQRSKCNVSWKSN